MTAFLFQIPSGTIEPGGPLPSADLTQGNIGLGGPSVVMLRLTEPDGVMPSDSAGNLDDLVAVTTPTTSVPSWTGRGRLFEGNGSTAADLPGRDTLSTRDVSVQAILSVVPASMGGAHGMTGRLYVRGLSGSTAERRAVGLELVAAGALVQVRMFWDDSAGVVHYQPVGEYQHPGDDEFVFLTATRRWQSATSVVVRYYLGEALLGEFASGDGDIAGATTGATSVGVGFAGVLDELRVTDYEISADEVQQTWRRMTIHQPAGVAMIRGLIPPGVSWMRDPGNRIGRLIKLVGQAAGYAMAKTEELRATWLPGTAYLEQTARWERIRGVAPRPRDSLDTRRARVVALFRREHGYSRPAIRAALAELFDQAAADVEILEFENEVTDGFDTLNALRWRLEPAAAWTAAAGVARVQAALGVDLATIPARALLSLSSGDGEIVVGCKLAAVPSFPTAGIVGLALCKFSNGHSLYVGIRNDGGGSYHFAVRSYVGGAVLHSTHGTIDAAWTPAAPLWLRIVGDRDVPGTYRVGYSLTGQHVGLVETTLTGRIVSPDRAGVAMVNYDTTLDAALDARFDDFVARTPEGTRPFHWYAFRDPLLPGEPDMAGAHAVVQKLKPAHTHAAAVTLLALRCDDPDSLCDRGPLGGI